MKPEIAIIARVGAHKAFEAAGLKPEKTEVYPTPYGDSRPVHWFRQGGLDFVVLSRHGEAGYEISAPFINARANLYALKALGVGKILAWVHGRAVYVATTGPRLETAAEIRKFGLLGGDLVGQTLAPEVFLARELEFCYTALTYVVNYAEGLVDRPYQPGVLFEGLATPAEVERVRTVETAFPELILRLLPALAATSRRCPCPRLMERYRLRGDIGEDWRTWVR
jgi:purine nucleoside phosphorylase